MLRIAVARNIRRGSPLLCHPNVASTSESHPPSRSFSVTSAIESIDFSIGHSAVIRVFEPLFTLPHDLMMGSPSWTITILLSSVVLQFATLPFILYSDKVKARQWCHAYDQFKQRRKKQLHPSMDIDFLYPLMVSKYLPFRQSIKFLPIPVWIASTLALRNLCGVHDKMLLDDEGGTMEIGSSMVQWSMSNEGVAWFTNLLSTDVYFLLPVLAVALHFHSVHGLTPYKKDTLLRLTPTLNLSRRDTILAHVGHGALLLAAIYPLPAAVQLFMVYNTGIMLAMTQVRNSEIYGLMMGEPRELLDMIKELEKKAAKAKHIVVREQPKRSRRTSSLL